MRNTGLLGCVVAIVIVLIIGGIWAVGVRNNIVGLDEQVNQKWAQVETQYQRRYDLIRNLVETVKGAAEFEKSTLEAVTNARARVGQIQVPAGGPPTASALPDNQAAMDQYNAAQGQLWGAVSRLIAVSEAYPDLKSNANFLNLQSQLEGTENRIAVERQRYNESVETFNATVRRFPANIVAGGFKPKAYFRGASGTQNAPDVNFDFGGKK